MLRFLRQAFLAFLVPTALVAQATPGVTREQRGDTLFIKYTGDGQWGPPISAVEDLRITGPDATKKFGLLRSVAVARSGEVMVTDTMGVVAYVFDREGHLVRTIAITADSPSGARLTRAYASPAGEFMLGEPRAAERFHLDGTPIGAFPLPQTSTLSGLQFSTDGNVIVARQSFYEAGTKPISGWYRLDLTGKQLDTLVQPAAWPVVPPATPPISRTMITVLQNTNIVVGEASRVALMIRPASGAGPFVITEVPSSTPDYLPEERANWQEYYDWQDRALPPRNPPPVHSLPAHKQAFTSMNVDVDGRLWVKRTDVSVKGPPRVLGSSATGGPAPAIIWDDPPRYAGFRDDGTYLGEVRFPPEARMIAFSGNVAWATLTLPDGSSALVRYRIAGAK